MSVKSNTDAILKDLDKYRNFLAGMSEEIFQRTPKEDVWSYSEVYSHILGSNTASLIAIERCVHGNKSGPGRLGFLARLVLFFGMFPPGARLKAPEKVRALA